MTTPARPSTAPRLRSMPSVRITSVMPRATMTSTATWSATFVRFAALRNSGRQTASRVHRMTRR
jgi:hypothetical protein